jgi:hypothetical protein
MDKLLIVSLLLLCISSCVGVYNYISRRNMVARYSIRQYEDLLLSFDIICFAFGISTFFLIST